MAQMALPLISYYVFRRFTIAGKCNYESIITSDAIITGHSKYFESSSSAKRRTIYIPLLKTRRPKFIIYYPRVGKNVPRDLSPNVEIFTALNTR